MKNEAKTKERHWWILIVSISTLLLFAFISIYFYKEKLLVDSGYRAFYIVNSKNFCFSNNRFILFLNQILPLITLNADCSLKIILKTFVLADIPVFILGSIISFIFLKSTVYTFIFPIGYIFFFGQFYFHAPDMEIHIQACFLYIMGMWYVSDKKLNISSIVAIFILFLIITMGHPIGIISAIFLIFIIQISRPLKISTLFLSIILLTAVLYLRWNIQDSYETQSAESISIQSIFFQFQEKINQVILILKRHPFVIILFIGLNITLFLKKNYLVLITFVIFTLGYILIVFSRNYIEYFEAYFLLFASILLIMSFKHMIIPMFSKHPMVLSLLLIFLVITEIYAIQLHLKDYHQKVELINYLSQKAKKQSNCSKFIYYKSSYFSKFETSFDFASSILITSLESKSNTKAIVSSLNIKTSIIDKWPYIDSINKRIYFPDYNNITTSELLKHYADIVYEEPFEYINTQKMWFNNQLNDNYFSLTPCNFEILK